MTRYVVLENICCFLGWNLQDDQNMLRDGILLYCSCKVPNVTTLGTPVLWHRIKDIVRLEFQRKVSSMDDSFI